MKRTIEWVRGECHKIAKSAGYDIYFPIELNSRLRTTLGRVKYKNGLVEVLEISKRHLENGSEESINETIRHELAHALVFMKDGYTHGHDKEWKQLCIALGGSGDTYYDSSKAEEYGAEPTKPTQYFIYCTCCGKLVGTRQRRCPVVNAPEKYFSSCCKAELRIDKK